MKVLFRVDGDAQIGVGHVMRCLALAEAVLERGGACCIHSARLEPRLQARIEQLGISVTHSSAARGGLSDGVETAARARAAGCTWVVCDGYEFAPALLSAIRAAGLALLSIDDGVGPAPAACELVLDASPSARAERFTGLRPAPSLLLGPRYALLRRELAQAARLPHPIPTIAERLLITLGGADPTGASGRVLEALDKCRGPKLATTLLVGPANPRRAELESQAGRIGVQLVFAPEHMAELMGRADLAVSAAGVTSYELAALGVPTLLLVLADNQVEQARALDALGACRSLGGLTAATPAVIAASIDALASDVAQRAALAQTARALIDGQGAARVVAAMEQRA